MEVKMHRKNNDHLKFQEQLGDFDTKLILLIQAAKNNAEGKDVSNLFDGIGDVISAVDHFKEMMKGQYAKLAEFKEIENSVESLLKFKSDYLNNKRRTDKENEEILDRFEDTIRTCEKLRRDVVHIQEDRIRNFENQMIEKVDQGDFEATVQNIQAYLENINADSSPRIRRERTINEFDDDESNKNAGKMSQESIAEVDDSNSEEKKSSMPNSSMKSSPKIRRRQSQASISSSKNVTKANIRDNSPDKIKKQSIIGAGSTVNKSPLKRK